MKAIVLFPFLSQTQLEIATIGRRAKVESPCGGPFITKPHFTLKSRVHTTTGGLEPSLLEVAQHGTPTWARSMGSLDVGMDARQRLFILEIRALPYPPLTDNDKVL